jgi:hypothetical protein
VFAADGQGISQWGGFLEAADVPSTMIVGVHGLADEMPRLQEYSSVFDAERFAAHEKYFRRGRRPMGAVAVRSRAARRTHRGVRCLGGRRARARPWASASGRLRCGLLRLAGSGLQAGWSDAELDSTRVPRRRHSGAVFPRQRGPVGGGAARSAAARTRAACPEPLVAEPAGWQGTRAATERTVVRGSEPGGERK